MQAGIKNVFLLLSGFLFGISAVLAQSGKLKMAKYYHYFGAVKEEAGQASHDFVFWNAGKAPLTIKQVKTSCGCTTPHYPKEAIQPGDSGLIKVEFNPLNRPGNFKKPIYITTDGSPEKVTLTISGVVRPRPKGPQDYYPFKEGNIRLKTNHLTYSYLYHDAKAEKSTILYNDSEQAIVFDLKNSAIPPHLKMRISKTELEPADTLHLFVGFDAAIKSDWGFVFDQIYLRTNDPDNPMKRINTSAHIREKFPKNGRSQLARIKLVANSLDYGEVIEGKLASKVMEIQNIGKSDLIIRKLHSMCSCLEFRMEQDTIPPGESTNLLVTFNTRGRIGQLRKDFSIINNSPVDSEVNIPVSIEVVRVKEE